MSHALLPATGYSILDLLGNLKLENHFWPIGIHLTFLGLQHLNFLYGTMFRLQCVVWKKCQSVCPYLPSPGGGE